MKKYTISTYGTALDNPGPAAIGVSVTDAKGNMVLEMSEAIGNATKDYAEYFAVVRAFQGLKDEFGDNTKKMCFELKTENEQVQSHLCAEEQIKDLSLIGHFIEVYNLRVSNIADLEILLVPAGENVSAKTLSENSLDA